MKIECEWVHFKEDTMEDRVRVGTLKIRHNGRKARRMSSLIFYGGEQDMTNKIYSTYEIKSMISGVAAEYGIETVYLFGSYARGQATEKSDIDLYIPVLPDKMGIKYFAMLEKLKENEEKIKKLQQDNVHKDAGPAAAEAKANQEKALTDLVRSFM